jgi:transposase-like protein
MEKIKRIHPASFKAKVALELIKGTDKLSEICSKHSIHPTQAGKWKQRVLENIANLFTEKHSNQLKQKDETIDELYRQIGQLKVELDWLKKKFPF